MEPASVFLGKIASSIAAKGFGALIIELFRKASASAGQQDQILQQNLFENHFSLTFERCTRVKTLLSANEHVNLLEQYVNTRFDTVEKATPVIVDDYRLIETLRQKRLATITGSAGSGKTVFMKYLWTAIFVDPAGYVPIFLELRRLNEITSPNIIAYILYNILLAEERFSVEEFKRTIAASQFIFIFDGFDEVIIEGRNNIERQILDIAARFPRSVVVVSGRPDKRFDSWQSFNNYHVRPMEKDQVIELVQKVEFDEQIKKKFIRSIKKDLFISHQSFLSAPLLASMMLITFKHHADIPEKMHVFYTRAFDTLFSMHDALKEAFSRRKYTGYSADIFRRRMACLCLITYADVKYEFDDAELADYISKSGKIDGVTIDVEAFTKDLMESVCLLQRDGLSIAFTHRSFQEYFTAIFLEKMNIEKLSRVLPKFADRIDDQSSYSNVI